MKVYSTLIGLLMAASVSAQTTGSTTEGKMAYTSLTYILEQMPEAKVITSQVTFQQLQSESELQRLQKEFQGKYEAYQKGGAQLSELVRADRAKELQALENRIQEFSRNSETALQQKYAQLMAPIQQKAMAVIGEVAKENGYLFVVNIDRGTSLSSDILYKPEGDDLTKLVLAKMKIDPNATPKPATPTAAAKKPAAVPAKAPVANKGKVVKK